MNIYWKESTIFGLHFFFLEEKHQRIDTCKFFFCCFDRDQIANVLLNDWKEHLKIKKKNSILFVTDVCLVGGRFLLAFWD